MLPPSAWNILPTPCHVPTDFSSNLSHVTAHTTSQWAASGFLSLYLDSFPSNPFIAQISFQSKTFNSNGFKTGMVNSEMKESTYHRGLTNLLKCMCNGKLGVSGSQKQSRWCSLYCILTPLLNTVLPVHLFCITLWQNGCFRLLLLTKCTHE